MNVKEWFSGEDENGNSIFIESTGTINFYSSKGIKTNIGRIVIGDKYISYHKKVNVKDLPKQKQAWCLNWHIISKLENESLVILQDKQGQHYELSMNDIYSNGYFKDQRLDISREWCVPMGKWRRPE